MRIDAHQHFWRIQRGDYGWITPDLPQLYRDFLPDDLLPHLERHRIDQTILVQAAPTIAETEFLLKLSETTDMIGGVVGWIDVAAEDYREQYDKLKSHPKLVGLRVMIQDMPDERIVLEPHFIEAMSYFAEQDVPIDLLVLSAQLPTLIELLDKLPGLRGVIDHIAKPRIAEGAMEPWQSQMREIAKHPNIYCKLSGMITEADHDSWQPEDFTKYIQHIIEVFGTDRIMFGSDWPVCLLAGSYDDVFNVLAQALPDTLTEADIAKLYGLNAKRFYKL